MSVWLTSHTSKSLFLLETNENNLPSLPTLATKNHIFRMRGPEDPSFFDTEITSFISVKIIVSLKLPAARITLKNISDSENPITLHQTFSDFLAFSFQYHFHATLNASLQLQKKWLKKKEQEILRISGKKLSYAGSLIGLTYLQLPFLPCCRQNDQSSIGVHLPC